MAYTLTVNVDDPNMGSVDPVSGTYDDGTLVRVTATAARWHKFDHWEGDASGIAPVVNITMNADKTLTAYFEELPLSDLQKVIREKIFPMGRLTPLFLSAQDYIPMSDEAKDALRGLLGMDGHDTTEYEEGMKRLWPREFVPKPLTWRLR